MNSICQVKQDILVVLDSRNATSFYNGNFMSDVEWDLTDIISKPKQAVEFSVSVINASIPIGQYNIASMDNTNNTVTIVDPSYTNPIVMTIPNGNYTITSLLTDIQSRGPPQYVWTYIAYKNRISVSNPNQNFTLTVSNSLFEPLGLAKGVTYSSTNKSITSPNCVNMSGLRNLNIHLDNVTTKNITSFTKSASTIIASIPVDINSGGVLSYNLSSDYEVPVPISNLDYINILLKDDLGNFIQNNGINWGITLKFSYYIQQDFSSETVKENINKNRISIIQPKIINHDIPEIFQTKEVKLLNE
jgi:hypothetical protein